MRARTLGSLSNVTIQGYFARKSLLIFKDSPLASVHQATRMIPSTVRQYWISINTISSSVSAFLGLDEMSASPSMYG
ncbi:uncharacterized protein LACBIDRAFT_296179 [Laccaria bicolor S238N-H82]|uniref:Predicted protein n=1 Tax=Laccaria bicolor (strain S238N-H82 / ATCC MYA-4686) TaxID=486041 RepID=B0D929_LACBS|nr:uncharacterized protein LACBIDRAFT_296549 [Laccaria bicolor S238N-H82]XP_001882317.1 uncharacterized protein LACBIDRAFT_299339 [Laccaria bicolor S238N-H82]XP_001884937.1 uncharacterized protein LACBIDRAFT_304454 [Laccaria bicolor S238N-H82]XP_001890561.1 uncharacterized protein LACBIDRAFT_296179 [Laccaria bicolor S238N-H82]EDQ98785.1 predicted protein [Laccaria bicolor S238N-H82]EDR04418.1 predicted protein [Laccaria bicolor S238N-H82]EDR06944.1 predicted protein [Laccaria bicolor S238N-H8|eukprot:XP_001880251.1 predicted protein [Laccaria bicolor S238N-H82]